MRKQLAVPTQHGQSPVGILLNPTWPPKSHALAEEFVQKARAEQAAKREKEGIKEEKVKVEVKKEEKEEKADKKGGGGVRHLPHMQDIVRCKTLCILQDWVWHHIEIMYETLTEDEMKR